MDNYEDTFQKATITFEGVKIAMRQDKNGYILTLAVHPSDVPDSLLRDWVGSRYQVAMVLLNDQDEPVVPQDKSDGEKAVMKAGLLCREREFQDFIMDKFNVDEWEREGFDEAQCSERLRDYCAIQSRSELKTNEHARIVFNGLLNEFNSWNV